MNPSSPVADSLEQLVGNLRSLLSEAEKMMTEPASEQAREKFGELRRRIEQAQMRLQECYGNVRQKAIAGAKQADEVIRMHPYESLAVVLGVGVLLGALIRRSS